jgi:hypothetical protein
MYGQTTLRNLLFPDALKPLIRGDVFGRLLPQQTIGTGIASDNYLWQQR